MTSQINSTPPSRVFAARLAGTGVFDPLGDRVGRVHDVVVVMRLSGLPRAVGLVVEVPGKRRVFLPLSRVTSIAAGAVITTGLLNLRRFVQRSSETLVVGQLLDRQVTLRADDGAALISDAAMEQQRNRDWLITQIYVQRVTTGRGLRRRRGESLVVGVDEVVGLALPAARQGAAALLARIGDRKPADLAVMLHDLPSSRRVQVARELTDERLADVLEELAEDDRVAIITSLEPIRAARVLDAMEPDDATDLMHELPEQTVSTLLDLMEPEEAEDVRRLLAYDEHTAGGLMTTEPLILPPESTVAAALADARRSDVPPALCTLVFVVRPPLETPTGTLLGVVHIQRALREPPTTRLGSILDKDIGTVGPDEEIGTVTRLLATYDLTALPVVDEAHRLLGAVSVDDVLDKLLPDDWRNAEAEETDTAMTRSAHG